MVSPTLCHSSMLEHNHQFAKPGVSDVLHFHQHEINFCSLVLLFFFLPAAFVLFRDLSHKDA